MMYAATLIYFSIWQIYIQKNDKNKETNSYDLQGGRLGELQGLLQLLDQFRR